MRKLFIITALLCCSTIAFGQANKNRKKTKTTVNIDKNKFFTDDEEEIIKVTKESKKDKDDEVSGAMDFEEGPTRITEEKMIMIEEKPVGDEQMIFQVVENMPSFPGGQTALMQFLASNVKYPPEAEENGIQGRVVCTFIVEKDGSINDVRVARGANELLDKEAVRVIKSMPKWTPGKQFGKPVRVRYTIPINFRLPDPEPEEKK